MTPETGNPLVGRPVGDAILRGTAYTDPAVFDAERRTIFTGRWVWAGFEHWLSAPGSIRPVTVAGQPLLITRDRGGNLHVFHNVCRHRGLVLADEPDTVTRLRCPYHSWTFGLSGELQNAPFWGRAGECTPSQAEREQLGLLPVSHQTWAGMIFVRLGPGQPGDDWLAPLRDRWKGVDLTRIHLAEERGYDIPANWKLVVENFLDFYHLPFVHPQVGPAVSALDVDDVVLAPGIIGGCYPHGAADKAAKTENPLPAFGEVSADWDTRQDIFCVFPNALLFLQSNWFQVIGYEPVSAGRTIEHMAVFIDASAAGDRYDQTRRELCKVLFQVNDQDLPILARLQRGRHSAAADRNHLLPQWDMIGACFQTLAARAYEP